MTRLRVPIAALAIALGMLACASEPEEAAEPTPTPAATTTDAEGDLEDGRHAAYIKTADAEDHTISVDVIQFLTGEAAKDAYTDETGDPEDPPNDYFIKNENERVRTLEVAEDAEIKVTGLDEGEPNAVDLESATFEQLAEYVNDAEGLRPFWMELEGGVVIDIEEQYVP